MGAQVCWRHRDLWTLRNDSKQGRCWRSRAGQSSVFTAFSLGLKAVAMPRMHLFSDKGTIAIDELRDLGKTEEGIFKFFLPMSLVDP